MLHCIPQGAVTWFCPSTPWVMATQIAFNSPSPQINLNISQVPCNGLLWTCIRVSLEGISGLELLGQRIYMHLIWLGVLMALQKAEPISIPSSLTWGLLSLCVSNSSLEHGRKSWTPSALTGTRRLVATIFRLLSPNTPFLLVDCDFLCRHIAPASAPQKLGHRTPLL